MGKTSNMGGGSAASTHGCSLHEHFCSGRCVSSFSQLPAKMVSVILTWVMKQPGRHA